MTAPPAAPLCRYCGKAIAKRSVRVVFGYSTRSDSEFWKERTERPATRAEVQRLFNDAVVLSISRHPDGHIASAGLWDGKSYVDPYFCNGDHAKRFAHVVARDRPLMRCY